MAIRRLTRPPREPDALRRFMREMFDAFAALGIAEGDEFLISNGKDQRSKRQLESHDEDATGGARGSDPETSRKGAFDVLPRSGTHRHRALVAIVAAGSHGLTYAEVEDATGIKGGVWKRLSELHEGGWIAPDGERMVQRTRSTAQVYKATEKGRRECGETLAYREESMI